MNVMEIFTSLCSCVRESYERSAISGPVLVGLSGGVDSVALLRILLVLQKEYGFELGAVHVNHGLRGNASLDEVFCCELCEKLHVPLQVERVCVSDKGSLEAAAREARYAAFARAKRVFSARTIALAHHMDDQAETILLHLLHGSGVDGLGGMREKKSDVWRPMLGIRRRQIQDALHEIGQDWREDESNTDVAHMRNRLRVCVLPVLEEAAPAAVNAICRIGDIAQDENDYLESVAAEALKGQCGKGDYPFIMADVLLGYHVSVQRRALRKYAARYGLELDYEQTERVRKLLYANSGSIENLPRGWQALRTKMRMHLIAPSGPSKVMAKHAVVITPYTGYNGDGIRRQAAPRRLVEQANVRTRMQGDYIQPFGMHGRKSLKEYLIDKGVDRPFRDGWPLLCIGNEVLWVPGVGVSQKMAISSDVEDICMATFMGDLPDTIQEGNTNGK